MPADKEKRAIQGQLRDRMSGDRIECFSDIRVIIC